MSYRILHYTTLSTYAQLGSSTIVFAIFAFFWLPRSVQSWRLLNQQEKDLARQRILADSSSSVDERLDIRDAFIPFKDWKYAVWAIISLSLGVPLASVNNFLPQIGRFPCVIIYEMQPTLCYSMSSRKSRLQRCEDKSLYCRTERCRNCCPSAVHLLIRLLPRAFDACVSNLIIKYRTPYAS